MKLSSNEQPVPRPSPSSRGPRGLLVLAALLLVAGLPVPALEADDVRAAVPGRAAAGHLQLQARGRERGPGRQGDQRPQPLHRDADLTTADFTEFKWIPFVVGALGLLFLRAAVLGKMAHARRRRRALPLLRPLLALVLRLQAVLLRPQPRADGGGEGRPVHAAALRLQAARELRGLLVPARGLLRARRGRRSCCSPRVVPRAGARRRGDARPTDASPDDPGLACSPAPAADAGRAVAARLEGRPAATRSRRSRRGSTPRAAGADVEVAARAPTGAISSSTGRSARRPRPAAARRVGRRQRRARPRADGVIDRGLRHRRPRRRRPRPRLVRRSTSPRRARRSATAGSTDALFGIYLREADGAAVERCRDPRHPGKDPGEKGSGIHVWNTDGFRLDGNVIADVRDGFYIQSSSHGFDPRQHRARPALRPPLHVLRRQRLRGQPLRERRRRHRAHVLAGASSSGATVPAQPRLRVGRPAVQGLRRRRSPRTTSSPTTRAASSSRARTATSSAATSSPSPTPPIVLYDSCGDEPSSRATRSSAT